MGVGAEPPGSRAWSGIKVVAYTHVPGWGREQPLFSVGSECAVCSLNYGPGRAKISGKFVAFCCGFFCLDAGAAALSCPRMSPRPSPRDTRRLGPSLDFSVPVPMESSALGCSGASRPAGCVRVPPGTGAGSVPSEGPAACGDVAKPRVPLVLWCFPVLTSVEEERTPSPSSKLLLRARSSIPRVWKFSLVGFFFGFWCCHVLLSRDPVGSEATCPKSEWCHVCVAERGVLGLLLHYKFQVCHMLQSTGFSFHFGSPRARLPSFRPPRPLCRP